MDFFLYRRLKELKARELEMISLLNFIKEKVTILTALKIDFYINKEGVLTKVDKMFLKVNQALPLTITIKDKFGNDAKVDGAPVWAVTDAALADIVASEDGMSATLTPIGPIGSFKVQVSADADLGAGVSTIMGELDIDLLAGDAVAVSIAAGEPVNA
jgi:hypothetical protein